MSTLPSIRVTKDFTFDMAHALYGYDGPCKNIHGHTYHLSITLLGKPIADIEHVKLGMVIDFGDLKEVVKKHIIEVFDHALVLNEEAPYSKSEVISNEFEKVILMPFQPTCENLLLHFVDLLQDQFAHDTKLVAIRLQETPNSGAEWRVEDNM